MGAGLPPAGHLSVGVSTPALCLHLRAGHLHRAETLPGPAVLLWPGLSRLMGRPSLASVLVREPRLCRGDSQMEPHVGSGVAAQQGDLGTWRGGAGLSRPGWRFRGGGRFRPVACLGFVFPGLRGSAGVLTCVHHTFTMCSHLP